MQNLTCCPGKVSPWIGRFSVKGVKADAKDDFMICKLKARVNLHGVLNVEQGYYVEEQEIEEPIPEPKDGDVRIPPSFPNMFGQDKNCELFTRATPARSLV